MFDHNRTHTCTRDNLYQTTFTYCGKFLWGVNFVTVRAVTKLTKISPPRKLPAIQYSSVIKISSEQGVEAGGKSLTGGKDIY